MKITRDFVTIRRRTAILYFVLEKIAQCKRMDTTCSMSPILRSSRIALEDAKGPSS